MQACTAGQGHAQHDPERGQAVPRNAVVGVTATSRDISYANTLTVSEWPATCNEKAKNAGDVTLEACLWHDVRRLMKLMRLVPIYQEPKTSKKHPAHKKYPYPLRDLPIIRPNQVWCIDITHIPLLSYDFGSSRA
jgi:hypothetical protein